MRASVVVPARDAAGTIGACLDGLAAQDLAEPFEVVVVDNGSRDGTAALAAAHPVVDRVVRRERGEGPGAARNDGVRAARAPLIAFLDSDCVPEPGWLRAGSSVPADIVQGSVLPDEGRRVGPFDRTLWVTSEVGLYETANLFVRREWFERAGGFQDFVDPERERPFGEDAWFAWRARRAGARTAFADEARVRHAVLPGTAVGYIAERRRDGHFAELVRLVPELRREFLYARLFLSRRSAAFELALAGALVAAARRSPLPLLALAPWLTLVAEESRRRTGVTSGRVSAAVAAGDAVAAWSLWRASVRGRTPVL